MQTQTPHMPYSQTVPLPDEEPRIYALCQDIVGPVSHLSLEGMTFEFFDHSQTEQPPSTALSLEVGLFASGGQLVLTGLCCRLESEAILPNGSSFMPGVRKQRRMLFTDLSSTQRLLLQEMVRLKRQR
jgi:hypothetical protein